MMAGQRGPPLEEFLHPQGEPVPCPFAGHEAKGLQNAADLIGEVDRHTLELGTGTNEMAHRMRGEAFDARLPIPARAHELGQSLSVVGIRLVALKSGRSSGVAGFDAHDG
jgi:hypothetical protein